MKTQNNKILTFHSKVNEKDTDATISVKRFYKHRKPFQTMFKKWNQTNQHKYKKISFYMMDGETDMTKREENIRHLNETPDDEITILSSCNTIGEGIDTKKANACVFVDPKNSWKAIIQNIGRITRLKSNKETRGSVLIPALVNKDDYKDCKTLEEKDKILRLSVSENSSIVNVVSAVKHDSSDFLFNACRHYPNKFTEQQVKTQLEKDGYAQVGQSSKNITDVLSALNLTSPTQRQTDFKQIAHMNHVCIEVRSTDRDKFNGSYKVVHNEGDANKKKVVIFKNEDTQEYSAHIPKPKRSRTSSPSSSNNEGCNIDCACHKCEQKRKKDLFKKIVSDSSSS